MGVATVDTRTPAQRAMDERDWTFEGTWPYEPRWLFTDDVRIHFVDEGPRSSESVVLMHGTPWWSYVFRDEIAELTRSGKRAVAYDQLGFGRSDKPAHESEYSLERDVRHLEELVAALSLERPVLVVQRSALPIARALGAAAEVVEREEPEISGYARAPVLGRLLLKGARIPLRATPLSDVERVAFRAPHPSWESRSGIVASLRRSR